MAGIPGSSLPRKLNRGIFAGYNKATCYNAKTRTCMKSMADACRREEASKKQHVMYICVWTVKSVTQVRNCIENCCSKEVSIVSTKRIRQRDGVRRIDIVLKCGILCNVVQKLRWNGYKAGIDRPNRNFSSSKRHLNEVCSRYMHSIMCLNMNGFWNKREDLQTLLLHRRPGIIALCETLNKWKKGIRLPGYTILEANMTGLDGERGVILGVRSDIGYTLSPLLISPNIVAGNISFTDINGTTTKILVISVYIPVVYSKKKGTITSVAKIIKHELQRSCHTEIIALGDWNMEPRE